MRERADDVERAESARLTLTRLEESLGRIQEHEFELPTETELKRELGVQTQGAQANPKVSVMLITYNHEKFIAQALESVLMQETKYSYEINVIEDCSTDRTQAIVMEYVAKYPHIVKPYFNAMNIGRKVTQRNFYRGFRTLKGEYFAILEGDDYWTSPHKLQRQVAFLEENPDFAICACNTVKMYADGSQEPHRFLYFGQRDDATIEDVINLQCFFHTTGVMYRNAFKGNPPRQYRSKWSCDIFVMISHAEFGKVRHLDEDMAVYRAHAGGMYSTMSPLDGWLFNIEGLRRYNRWLHYRHLKAFSESIARYCGHVLREAGKDSSEPLSREKRARLWGFRVSYGVVHLVLSLPELMKETAVTAFNPESRVSDLRKLSSRVKQAAVVTWNPESCVSDLRKFSSQVTQGARAMVTPRSRLSEMPRLPGSSEWHFVWGLNAKVVETEDVTGRHPVMRLMAVPARDKSALNRHAFCAQLGGFVPGVAYRVMLRIQPVDGTNVHIQLRDSVVGDTGRPAHEGDVWFHLISQSVARHKGDITRPTIQLLSDGWLKLSMDFATSDTFIYVYLGLVKKSHNSHVFRGAGEQVFFGGISVEPASHSPMGRNIHGTAPVV